MREIIKGDNIHILKDGHSSKDGCYFDTPSWWIRQYYKTQDEFDNLLKDMKDKSKNLVDNYCVNHIIIKGYHSLPQLYEKYPIDPLKPKNYIDWYIHCHGTIENTAKAMIDCKCVPLNKDGKYRNISLIAMTGDPLNGDQTISKLCNFNQLNLK